MFAKTQSKIHEITFYRDINKKINELLESLSKLEVNATDKITPRTKQNLFKNDIKKVFDTLFFILKICMFVTGKKTFAF